MPVILRSIFLLLCSLLFVGCSVFSITYNYADTFIRWQLDDYFNLTKEQEKWLKPRLTSLMAWHRQEEMPQYVAALQVLKEQAQDGYTLEELEMLAEAGNQAYFRATEYMLEDTVSFLLQLSPQQIDHLEKYLAKKNRQRIKERGATLQEQVKYGQNLFIENIQKWAGVFTPKQIDLFTHIYKLGRTDKEGNIENWDKRRNENQQAWLAMLRSKPDRATLKLWLNHWLTTGSPIGNEQINLANGSANNANNNRREENIAQGLQNVLVIDKALTTKQRQKALDTLQKWINRMEGVL